MSEQKKRLLELLEKHGESLHRLLFRMTLSEETAEDLMQELFLKLFDSVKISSVQNLYSYAHRMAINLAFDRLRRLRRTNFTKEITKEPACNGDTPLQELVRQEEQQQTLAAVSKLKNPYRDIIVLRYIEQESYESIAEQTGKTAKKIRAICSKGIKKLRELLNNNQICSVERRKNNVEV